MNVVNVIITDNELHNVRSKLLTVQDNVTEEAIVKRAYNSFHYEGYSGYIVYTETNTIWDGVDWKEYDYTLEYAEIPQQVVICSECQQPLKDSIKNRKNIMDIQKLMVEGMEIHKRFDDIGDILYNECLKLIKPLLEKNLFEKAKIQTGKFFAPATIPTIGCIFPIKVLIFHYIIVMEKKNLDTDYP